MTQWISGKVKQNRNMIKSKLSIILQEPVIGVDVNFKALGGTGSLDRGGVSFNRYGNRYYECAA